MISVYWLMVVTRQLCKVTFLDIYTPKGHSKVSDSKCTSQAQLYTVCNSNIRITVLEPNKLRNALDLYHSFLVDLKFDLALYEYQI
jgi:hypothetical protein